MGACAIEYLQRYAADHYDCSQHNDVNKCERVRLEVAVLRVAVPVAGGGDDDSGSGSRRCEREAAALFARCQVGSAAAGVVIGIIEPETNDF